MKASGRMKATGQEEKPCYICGGHECGRVSGAVRDRADLGIFRCSSCGLVFLSPVSESRGASADPGMYSGYSDPALILKETERDDERRFRFMKPLIKNKSVLDFGCGVGGFLSRAKEYASFAAGLDVEERLFPLYESSGLTVFRSIQEAARRKFDFITLFHVLEHIDDPRQLLSSLGDLLVDGGRIIVEIPSADDALITLYENEPFSRFTYWSYHKYLFSSGTLGALATQAGLKTQYLKQVQRYPLSNHLHWMAKGKPGGHVDWSFIDSYELHAAYEKQLAAMGRCDTIMGCFSKS